MFDFSNYPEDSKFFDPTNKKVIGKMKEESEGKIIGTFAIQRCIPWTILMVKNLIQQKEWKFQLSLMNSLFNREINRYKMRRIQSKKHKMGTYKISKISLFCFDDKRFVLNDGIHNGCLFS